MRPSSAKAKGRRLQQKIVHDLLVAFRGALEPGDVRSVSMGAGGEDILLSPKAMRLVPYSFEAKNQERLNVWSAVEQASQNCPHNRAPCVVFSKNRADTYAVVPWDHFLTLIAPPSQQDDVATTVSASPSPPPLGALDPGSVAKAQSLLAELAALFCTPSTTAALDALPPTNHDDTRLRTSPSTDRRGDAPSGGASTTSH